MNKIRFIATVLTLLLICSIMGCRAPVNSDQKAEPVDYSDNANWLMLAKDPQKQVDVFYLYPTAWHKVSDEEANICEIDNQTMREGAPRAYDTQATAFETVGNIYAPYYRQADAEYCLTLSEEEQTKLLGGIPKSDVFASLDYYFEYYNNGRPFLLAGHSQGSNMLLFVLSEYMKEHPERYQRMVAAYVIGYSVTEEFLKSNPHLKFAAGAEDTGVIISYNTEAPSIEGSNPVLLDGALSINPISWTLGEETAPKENSLGSRINGEKVSAYADATVNKERGVVICSTANPDEFASASPLFGKGVYHGQDYPFYYYDIRANVELRVSKYFSLL